MKFFDLFKKKSNSEPPIPENEKKYYQPDGYYTQTDIRGADVITFEERKKTSTISHNGLYVAEILLLQYVSYGTYPHPNNGYPGFWWLEYGIRNVGAKLQSLEERGFIRMSTPLESVSSLTAPQIKEILRQHNLPLSGKKDDLVQRVKENLSDSDVSGYISERKYTLTDLGKNELSENEYVPIMHKNQNHKFLWEINSKLPNDEIIRSFLLECMKKFPYIIEEILCCQDRINVNQKSWQKRFYDTLWGELNRKSIDVEQNFGSYCDIRLKMGKFSKDEQRYRDAVMFYSEVIFLDLNCYRKNFNITSPADKEFAKSISFPYEKSQIKIPEDIISDIEICQSELNINDDELRIALLNGVKSISAFLTQIFEYEETVNIFFWQRDKNFTELDKLYQKAEKKFDVFTTKLLEKHYKELDNKDLIVDKISGDIIGIRKPNGNIAYFSDDVDTSDITVTIK